MRRLAVALVAVALVGCATIMHGTRQSIGFTSHPTGASVSIDGQLSGQTPVILWLPRKNSHVFNIDLKGYMPFDGTITRSASAWAWGNILFGGLIGLAVDAISGGLYKLTPEQVTAAFGKSSASVESDGIFVVVVLQPDPSWELVGTLTPKR